MNATGNVYTQVVQPFNDNTPKSMNIRTLLTGNLNLSSETGNIYLNTNSVNRFMIDPSGYIYLYGTLMYQEILKVKKYMKIVYHLIIINI